MQSSRHLCGPSPPTKRCSSPELLRCVSALLCAADACVALRSYWLPFGLCNRTQQQLVSCSCKPTSAPQSAYCGHHPTLLLESMLLAGAGASFPASLVSLFTSRNQPRGEHGSLYKQHGRPGGGEGRGVCTLLCWPCALCPAMLCGRGCGKQNLNSYARRACYKSASQQSSCRCCKTMYHIPHVACYAWTASSRVRTLAALQLDFRLTRHSCCRVNTHQQSYVYAARVASPRRWVADSIRL